MVGIAFSGKSTLAKKIARDKNAVLVSQDQVWFEKLKELDLDIESNVDWNEILKITNQKVRDELANGNSVVIDNANLRHIYRQQLVDMAREYDAKSIIIFLDTPLEVQKERQLKNLVTNERHNVKQELIDEANAILEPPETSETVFVFRPDTDVQVFLSKLP